ncbi:hypothetical protein Bpfe_007703 [Biomphalaria pfeifferi]|uniref:Uncharacterized protein n=1 Tax=Biomphalaria pfeifferi TaxID=112525 RepID=A0AAD8BYG3_BIOPF|nr:hypothetical protein Bpfe_007703 [Biomphalaria pfeifferi]
MDIKHAVQSLQIQCCKVISLNTNFTESSLEEINQPCLNLIVEYLSVYDILRLEKVLLKRGINVKSALYRLQRILFFNNETYPIKSTTCPHLLDLFPCDGWDWGLSRLLYRRAIVQLIEEYDKGSSLPSGHLVDAYSYLLDLFTPINTQHIDHVKKRVMDSANMVEHLAVLAAHYVLFITLDQKHSKFLLDRKNEAILDAFCGSLMVISVILKSSPLLLTLVKILKERAQKLERISINVIRTNDLQYFDSVLSICSGVLGYYSTVEGQKDKKHLMSLISSGQDEASIILGREKSETNCAEYLDQTISDSETNPDFDLMDDAVLFGTSGSTSKFDSNAGMTKADFKFTNLVDKDFYVPVLDHHLRSWLSLRELHLGVPELPPQLLQGLCSLLQRAHLKSFTLSSTDYNYLIMEDILTAVASRSTYPLDKLMFVSLQERVENIEDLLVNDHLSGKSSTEIDTFIKLQESQKIAALGEFHGTKLLEVYLCTLGVKTECVLAGFVSRDTALTNLCFSNSVSRLFVQNHLRYLTIKNRQMTTLILEDWQVLTPASCSALSSCLSTLKMSLQSLSLKGCLHTANIDRLAEILIPVSMCKNLIALDLSENNLGEAALSFVSQIIRDTNVKDISLRKNGFSCSAIVHFLKEISGTHNLETLDLRGNRFLDCHRQQYSELAHSVAKFILVDNALNNIDAR